MFIPERYEKNMNKTMKDYIIESASTVIQNVERSESLTKALVDEFAEGAYRHIWMVASGSSYNGALAARPFLRTVSGCEVKLLTPASFSEYEHDLSDEDFVFVISQSGCSTNSINALRKLKEKGKKAIGLTGDVNSDFKDAGDVVIDYGSGVETVHYVTKGVTTLIVYLMLFAIESALKSKRIDRAEATDYKTRIVKIMMEYPHIIDQSEEWIDRNNKSFLDMQIVYLCGIGSNLGTANEGSLKISETVHIPCITCEIEEFIHGWNLQLKPDYTVIIFDNGDHTKSRSQQIYQATRKVTDKAFLITNNLVADDRQVLKLYDAQDEFFNPLVYLPVVQMIAYRVSSDLHTSRHPLLKEFNKVVHSKTEQYIIDNE